jgi:hypothetical protein
MKPAQPVNKTLKRFGAAQGLILDAGGCMDVAKVED